MDFSELDDALDDTDYVPTFGRAPKATTQKPLLKNSSAKSIESGMGQSLTNNNKLNFLQTQKDSRKQSTTFQDFFKQQQQPNVQPKVEARRQRSNQPKQPPKLAKPSTNKNDFNPNILLDEEDQLPAMGRRNMKPPISRKNDDSKSVISRKDDNKSVGSVAQFKKAVKEDQRPFINNISLPSASPISEPRQIQYQKAQVVSTPKEIPVIANFDFKAVIQQQLNLERQLNQKLMKELQDSHKSEIQRLTKLHEDQIKRRLQLKDLQLNTIKQHYQLKIKSITERIAEVKDMQRASDRLQEGVKALQRAEGEFKNKSLKLDQQSQFKNHQSKSFETFFEEKQKNIKQMTSQLQARQKQFREQKQNMWQNLERQRKKNQQFQARLLKRERQLQDQYNKKQRNLVDQYDQKSRKINDSQSKLRYAKLQLQQQKLRFQQQREQNATRSKKWEENRLKMVEQVQLQKAKLITRQSQLNSMERELQVKQNDLLLMQKQIHSKAKFLQLQRKKQQVQNSVKKKTGISTFYGNISRQTREPFEEGPSVFEKSLKQLKNEYLKNLGHI